MILYSRIWYFFALITLLVGSITPVIAQQNTDLTTIKVDELSDDQVEEFGRVVVLAGGADALHDAGDPDRAPFDDHSGGAPMASCTSSQSAW